MTLISSNPPADRPPASAAHTRTETDSMGPVQVPADALYGAQTQRAIDNFGRVGGEVPCPFIRALLQVKAAAARANASLGVLETALAKAIEEVALGLAGDATSMSHFPVDVYQTGPGTSSNMNVNEVVATLASRRAGAAASPNDHVNLGQSSNDVVPSCIHISVAVELADSLLPALHHLARTIEHKGQALRHHVKTGRTHLMDAMPVRMDQVFGAWAAQVTQAAERLEAMRPALHRLALGGTAVGTGVNAHPRFAELACAELARITGQPFVPGPNRFVLIGSQDTAVAFSGQLQATAVALTKVANDLRWMNSGPLAGLSEIELPALQPGSSIMPGKVNPVVPEAVAMMAAQVTGHHAAVAIAGQSGQFELNVMLPLVAHGVLGSMHLLAHASRLLADRAVAGLKVNEARLQDALARNPILATALNPHVGYLRAAEIAKRAYAESRPILDVADEMTDLGREQLQQLLDPRRLTGAE